MRESRHSGEQIIEVLKELEAGLSVVEAVRKDGVSEQALALLEEQVWRIGSERSAAAQSAVATWRDQNQQKSWNNQSTQVKKPRLRLTLKTVQRRGQGQWQP